MDELELEAVALVGAYGWAMPRPVKEFLQKMAFALNWEKLKGALNG